jgi:hypothetical protein
MVWTFVLYKMIARYKTFRIRGHRQKNRTTLSQLSTRISMTSRTVEASMAEVRDGPLKPYLVPMQRFYDELDLVRHCIDTSIIGVDTRFTKGTRRLGEGRMRMLADLDRVLFLRIDVLHKETETMVTELVEGETNRASEDSQGGLVCRIGSWTG